MSDHYILDENNVPVQVDWLTWAQWFEGSRVQRVIRQNLIDNKEPWISADIRRERENIKRRKEMGMSVKASNLIDIRNEVSKILVSTVFLGLDHSYNSPRPILFETMVFRGPLSGEMDRYSTMEEAKHGHTVMMEKVQASLNSEAWSVIEGGRATGSGK